MAGLRFAGQEGSVSCINSTTQDEVMPSLNVESVNVTLEMEMTTKQFIGQTGPTYREFANGASLDIKLEHNDADETAAMIGAIQAKAEGKSSDEFALQTRYVSADSGKTLQFTFYDLHFESIPFDMGGRTSFLETGLKAKCARYKVQVI